MESVSKEKDSDGVSPESSSFILHCCQLTKSHKSAKFQSHPKLGVNLCPLVINSNCKRMAVMWVNVHCCGFLEYIFIFIWKMKNEMFVWDNSLISLMSEVLTELWQLCSLPLSQPGVSDTALYNCKATQSPAVSHQHLNCSNPGLW